MADIFSREDARKLLNKKFILMLGDSNIRILYKDLLVLLNNNVLTADEKLRRRGEANFEGDNRIRYFGKIKGDKYVEDRDFRSLGIHIQYHFITRCYNEYIETVLRNIKSRNIETPAVIVMNSSIWDMSNYGANYVEGFKMNMQKLINLLNECLTDETIFIWISAVPVSSKICTKSFNNNQNFEQHKMLYDIMEANTFSRNLVTTNGYDFLDIHYYLIRQQHRRKEDGLHFNALVMRYVTNLFLTHVALSWNEQLPNRVQKGIALNRNIERFQNNAFIESPKIDPATIPTRFHTELPVRKIIRPQRTILPLRGQSQQQRQIPTLVSPNTVRPYRYPNWSTKSSNAFQLPVWMKDNQWSPSQRPNFQGYLSNSPDYRHLNTSFPPHRYDDQHNQSKYNEGFRSVGSMKTVKRTPRGQTHPYARSVPRSA